jgi:predicted aspartyl protease
MLAVVLAAVLSASGALEDPITLEFGRTPAGHYTLDVEIAGDPVRPFIFDTAASHTSIVEPVAARFGFVSEVDELHTIQTVTEEIEAERFTLGRLSLGPYAVSGVNAVVIPTGPEEELSVAGLIGTDVFEGQIVRADLTDGQITFNAAPPRHEDGIVDPERAVLVGRARVARARGTIMTLVDTGSARTIVNSDVARLMQTRYPTSRVTVASVSRAAQEIDDAGLVLIDRVRIGGLCVGPLLAVRADVDVFRAMGWDDRPAMILGVDALQSGALTIDYANGAFELGSGGGAPDCRTQRVQLGARS